MRTAAICLQAVLGEENNSFAKITQRVTCPEVVCFPRKEIASHLQNEEEPITAWI
jgi:hypothetical protein